MTAKSFHFLSSLSMSEDTTVTIAVSELKSLMAEAAREAVRTELAAVWSHFQRQADLATEKQAG